MAAHADRPDEDHPGAQPRERPGVPPEDGAGLAELAAAIEQVAGDLAEVWGRPHQPPANPIPATQLRVLFILARRVGVNVSGLAAELGASLPSTSRLCDRLEAGGLLVRDPGQNRREITVRVSRDGLELLESLRRLRREELGRALSVMPAAARGALLTGLVHFSAAVRHSRGRPTA